MKKLVPMLAVAVVFAGLGLIVRAAEDVTLRGEGVCAKCALKVADACQNVLQVEKDGETVKYFLVMNDVSKKAHGGLGICTAKVGEGPKLEVKGDLKEEDGKKVVTPTSIEKAE